MLTQKTVLALLIIAGFSYVNNSTLSADSEPVQMVVNAPKVSIEQPASTFSSVVTPLRFDPLIDLHDRNFAEAQSDITIRGGIFDNSEISIGSASLFDPQTGHYTADVPISLSMLNNPSVRTGLEQALYGFQAVAGSINYEFNELSTYNSLLAGFGDRRLNTQKFDFSYQGKERIGFQMAGGHSSQNGTQLDGESELWQGTVRSQYVTEKTQTDLVYGHSDKDIKWNYLYALKDLHNLVGSSGLEGDRTINDLFILNHKIKFNNDEWLEASAWHRKLKDDYEFDVSQPGLFNAYQHETKTTGVALKGENTADIYFLKYNAVLASDQLDSTALVFGNYDSRATWSVSALPGIKFNTDNTKQIELYAGPRYDDSNRSGESVGLLSGIALQDSHNTHHNTRYYVEVSQSSQLPNYTALNSNSEAGLFRGNANLKELRSTNYELGIKSNQATYDYGASLFYRNDNNLTDWTYDSSILPYSARSANNVDIDVLGLEYYVTLTDQERRQITIGYTYLEKDSNYNSPLSNASFYALNFAKHRAVINTLMPISNQLKFHFDNEIRRQQENSLRTGTKTPLISALALEYTPDWLENTTLMLVADNIFNSGFEEVPGVPPQGRLVACNLQYVW